LQYQQARTSLSATKTQTEGEKVLQILTTHYFLALLDFACMAVFLGGISAFLIET